jgi:hypothetical protein
MTLFTFTNVSDIDFTLSRVSGSNLPQTIVVLGRNSVDVIIKNEKLTPTGYEVLNSHINGYDHVKMNLFN